MANDMTDKQIWDYIYSYIGNEYGTAAVMGNLKAESNMQSNNLQQSYEYLGSDDSYTANVDNGSYSRSRFVNDSAGYGLAQWTYSSRKANLYDYCKSHNLSIGSTKAQVGFLMQELQSYSGVYNTLKNATSVREASNAMLHDFEKPANQSSEMESRRADFGQGYFDSYNGNSTKLSASELDALGGSLSDQNLEIKVDNVVDIASEWLSKYQSLDFESLNLVSTFQPLTSCEVLSSLIPAIVKTLDSIGELVVSTAQMIKDAVSEQSAIDDSYQNANDSSGYSGGRSGGSGGHGGGGNRDTDTDNTDAPVEIDSTLIDISQLDDNSIVSLVSSLYYMDAKGQIDLEKYLSDIKYAENLKILLLLSPNIPNDLKQLIAQMNPKTLQAFLKKMVGEGTQNVSMDQTTIDVTYQYLKNLSGSQGDNINTLAESDKISETLIDTEKTLEKINNNEQEALGLIYDGNTTEKAETVQYLRTAIDYISDKNEISSDEFLNNTAYKDMVVSSVNDLKASLKTINGLDGEKKKKLIKSIVSSSSTREA